VKYEPTSPESRRLLGESLVARVLKAGFVEEPRHGERVFWREVTPGIRVMVWSSVVGGSARPVAEDAIRVSAVYRAADGKERGIVKVTRVNRVGEVEAIVERVIVRMREAWDRSRKVERCHCGAPKFETKKKTLACAALCWTRSNPG